MSSIAEEIVEGYVCSSCAVIVDFGIPGFPRKCDQCKTAPNPPSKRIECTICGKRVKPKGLSKHQRENENCKKQAEIQNPDVPEADQVIYLSPEAAWNSAIEDQEGADGDYWSS